MRRRTRRALLTVVAAAVLGGGGLQLPSIFGDAVPDLTGPLTDAVPDVSGPIVDMLNRLSTRTSHTDTPTAYTREAFGQAWSDDVTVAGGHDGCDTRNDILRRDAVPDSLSIKAGTRGCKVRAGQWVSPYTGETIIDRSKASIDHIVPLAEAWASGAATWTADQRRNYANDPRVLLTVDARSNQSKGADPPDKWLPRKNRCDYAHRWITIKATYHLTATSMEERALTRILAGCQTSK